MQSTVKAYFRREGEKEKHVFTMPREKAVAWCSRSLSMWKLADYVEANFPENGAVWCGYLEK